MSEDQITEALSLATSEQILDELFARFSACLVLAERPVDGYPKCDPMMGRFRSCSRDHAIGLMDVATDLFKEEILSCRRQCDSDGNISEDDGE